MPEYRVIFVEPKNTGNLGSMARIMKNFGFTELYVTNTSRIPPEDQFRAMKGIEILKNVHLVKNLNEAIGGLNYVVGTSGVKSDSIRGVIRNHLTPEELMKKVSKVKGKIGIVFGREDIGLLNEELAKCDYFVHIPASEDYPIMNVSHAAAILLRQIYSFKKKESRVVANRNEMNLLVEKFKKNLIESNYPSHRIEKTTLMFRRVMSRALINEYEYRVLMGSLGCGHNRDERGEVRQK